jgi:mono/diheme cytochrome c family protein
MSIRSMSAYRLRVGVYVTTGVALVLLWLAAVATGAPVSGAQAQEIAFSAEYLNDPANIATGKTIWSKRCKFCHGKQAYPGKAPRLQPSRYTPEFVYDRVTNGFRGMPSWKNRFSQEERKAVTAYVISKEFSN